MDKAVRATLYLGANVNGNPGVTDDDFSEFLNEYVTPRFPGFTVRENVGYWHGQPELSRELIIVFDGEVFRPNIEQIGRDYKHKFHQETVMVSYEPISVQWDVPARNPVPTLGWTSRDGDPITDQDNKRIDVV